MRGIRRGTGRGLRLTAKLLLRLARRALLLALRAARPLTTARRPEAGEPGRLRVRILLLHAYGMGGTTRAVLNLAGQLATAHDVEIISLRRNRDKPFFPFPAGVKVTALDDHIAPRGWACRLLSRLPSVLTPVEDASFRWLSLWSDLRLAARLATLRCDVLIGTRPSLNLLVADAAPRGVLTIGQDHMNLGSYRRELRAAIVRRYRRLDVVAVLTATSLADYSAALAGAPVKVVKIPNSLPALPGGPATGEGRVVLAAGRLIPQKGFDMLIEAFSLVAAKHPDWTLRIFGSGSQRDELLKMIAERGLGHQIDLRGRTTDLAGELSKASVYALSSRHEGLPMVLIEAMSKGLAPVAFDCPTGPAEMITHRRNGILVPAEDVAAFAAALDEVLGDDELRRDLAAGATAAARAYDPAVIGASWNNLLAAHRPHLTQPTPPSGRPQPGR
ncbi:MAG TPA: glycosyltransferase family 4 protein [Streptosporangiaceae bacterium]|nr:glycosyltransferase family 4 protein [Streptosporangiaceae bacterium]